MPRLVLAAVLLAAVLAACDGRDAKVEAPPPRELSDAAVGRYCGMALTEHPGPKGQVFVRGFDEPYWFSSVRDVFAFTMLPEEPKDIAAIYVNDMGRAESWDQPEPGTWVEARAALYVIGSDRQGGMGGEEAVPFGDEAQAKAFAARNGGRVVSFAGMPADYIFPSPDPPAEAKRSSGGAPATHGH
jgi:copper chaperone NosL